MKNEKNFKGKGNKNYNKSKDYNKQNRSKNFKYNEDVFHSGSKANEEGTIIMDKVRGNDIAWWSRSSLYPLASSVQYNMYPGYVYDHEQLLPVDFSMGSNAYRLGSKFSDAGVLCYRYVSVFTAKDANDPINQCFNTLYARLIQNTNSGNVGFQQADLALLTLGLQSIVTLIAEAKRAIGLTNVFYRENAYYPMVILKSLGYDYETMKLNRPIYVSRLQNAIRNFNAMGIPSYIDLFKRGVQMGRNVYCDEDSLSGTPFMFKNVGYYIYEDTESKLTFTPIPETDDATNFEKLLDVIDLCIQKFRDTSDLGNIMGAIRRAFPETALIALDDISLDETTYPAFDRNVAWQVNNMTILGDLGNLQNMDVTQDPAKNILIQQPRWYGNPDTTFNPEWYYLNTFTGEVGNEFAMESSRLIPILQMSEETSDYYNVVACGTEIVMNARLTYRQVLEQGGFNIITWDPFHSIMTFDDNPEDIIINMEMLCRLSKFKNHPRVWLAQSNLANVAGFIGDMYVYTSINRKQLETLHLAALQSMYSLTV